MLNVQILVGSVFRWFPGPFTQINLGHIRKGENFLQPFLKKNTSYLNTGLVIVRILNGPNMSGWCMVSVHRCQNEHPFDICGPKPFETQTY